MSSSSAEFDPNARSTMTWASIQLNQAYISIFGFLCFWGAQTVYLSAQGYYKRRKPIYLLNFLQCAFLLIKTITATVYATYFNLDCEPRGVLVNVPLVISWILIYSIILLKLLIFTPWPKITIATFGVTLLTHFIVVMVGVALRTTNVSSSWTCRDVYPLIYKQQYIIELILEIISIGFLIHGLASKEQGGLFETTQAILGQLRSNEHLRVFLVLIFIAIKIALSYSNPPFDTRAFTHFVDSCRSGLVCWAILREQKTVLKAVTRSRQNSTRPFGTDSLTGSAARNQSVAAPTKSIVTNFGPIPEEESVGGLKTSTRDPESLVIRSVGFAESEAEPLQKSADTINESEHH